jgi:CDP-diacylglycerol--glycerol-3-phosphate 3-phosphatidyltransferase
MIYLIMLAMAGSLMISYTRARAESLGLDAEVGLMARAERVVLIGGSALFFGLNWNGFVLKAVIFILAVLTNITAIQRIVHVYRQGTGVPLPGMAPKPRPVDDEPTTVPAGAEASTETNTSARA